MGYEPINQGSYCEDQQDQYRTKVLLGVAAFAQYDEVLNTAVSSVSQRDDVMHMKFLIGGSASLAFVATHTLHDGSDLTPFLFFPTRICVP